MLLRVRLNGILGLHVFTIVRHCSHSSLLLLLHDESIVHNLLHVHILVWHGSLGLHRLLLLLVHMLPGHDLLLVSRMHHILHPLLHYSLIPHIIDHIIVLNLLHVHRLLLLSVHVMLLVKRLWIVDLLELMLAGIELVDIIRHCVGYRGAIVRYLILLVLKHLYVHLVFGGAALDGLIDLNVDESELALFGRERVFFVIVSWKC